METTSQATMQEQYPNHPRYRAQHKEPISVKLKVFSIHDSKAEAFIQPFYSQTTGTAVRSFEQACNDITTDFHKFAGDYTLFELGEFDQNSGQFTSLKTHLNLGLALSYVKTPDS